MKSTRPTVMEINLNHIAHNVRQFNQQAPKAELMAVVKADAYGCGAAHVAATAIQVGATWLGVATPSEGVALRKLYPKIPILVLGGLLAEEVCECHDNDLDVIVHSHRFAHLLGKNICRIHNPLQLHLKIDTGMHRNGVLPEDLPELIAQLKHNGLFEVKGICTHFPSVTEDLDFSNHQLHLFSSCVTLAEKLLGPIPYKHAANSSATILLPQSHFNLVRIGLGLYGYHDDPALNNLLYLKPAVTLKTRITSIRKIPVGAKVGYGGTYVADRPLLIATIPIGYADGYKRSLSNKGVVLVNGCRADIIGRVCMDQCMINITRIPEVHEGDEVMLIGKQKENEITLYELSDLANTIPNDVLASMPHRVERVYLQETP
jgi:alanine racemase